MSLFLLLVFVILVLLIIILFIGIYQKNTNEICTSKKRSEGRTVIVTGGTAGMGLEMARDFAQRGAHVIIASPFPTEGASAVQELTRNGDNPDIVFKLLDLSSFESIRNFVADILNTEDRLDILINNAGVGGPAIATRDGLNFVMQVNYYGTFLITILLLPILKKTGHPGAPSRIVNVSSAAYILGRAFENTFLYRLPLKSYIISKFYLVMFTRELAKRLKNSNVVANSADPGVVGTNIFFTFANMQPVFMLVKFFFWVLFKHPWQGAQTAIHVALDKKAGEVSGEYFKNCKQTRTANVACNENLAIKLWNESVASVLLNDNELR